MVSCVHTVCQDAVEVAREAIDKSHDGHHDTERGVGDAILSCQAGHCEGEVLANKVEEGVAQHRHDDCAPLPTLESLFSLSVHICGRFSLLFQSVSLFYQLAEYLDAVAY